MLKRMIVLVVMSFLVLLITSACWAEEKPFESVTGPNEVIEKVFKGRTLDSIEGVWVRDPGKIIGIVKSSVIYPNQPQTHDYYMIKIRGFSKLGMGAWIDRTEYDFCFNEANLEKWKLLSPDVLEKSGHLYPPTPNETYVRLDPAR